MKRISKWMVCSLLVLGSGGYALEKSDQEAISKIVTNYTRAWNENEGRGFGEDFSKDADFVNIFGMKFSGKGEIEERHRQILQTFLKGSKMEILKTDLREAGKGLVIATVYWRVKGFRKPDALQEGVFTQVFIQTDNRWEITASQNTLISN